MATVASTGFELGRIILKNTPAQEQPSMIAAFSKSLGMDKKYCLNKKMAVTLPDKAARKIKDQ